MKSVDLRFVFQADALWDQCLTDGWQIHPHENLVVHGVLMLLVVGRGGR